MKGKAGIQGQIRGKASYIRPASDATGRVRAKTSQGEQSDGQDLPVPRPSRRSRARAAAAVGWPWPADFSPAVRQRKVLLSLRIDPDVQEWFRAQGPGWQTRMNGALRAYMEHVRSDRDRGSYLLYARCYRPGWWE